MQGDVGEADPHGDGRGQHLVLEEVPEAVNRGEVELQGKVLGLELKEGLSGPEMRQLYLSKSGISQNKITRTRLSTFIARYLIQ